jgi:polar amino acid transport system substrate-binding protein
MLKNYLTTYALPILIALVLAGPDRCQAFSNATVILTTHNLYPYGSYPEGAPVRRIADETFAGVAIDTVRCVFKNIGVPLEVWVIPWERAQVLVKRGEVDGFFAASQKDSRDAFAVMSVFIADQNWNWYLLKESPFNPLDASFKVEAKVGGFIGANMLMWMQENGYNVTATPQDTESLLRMLLAKRVDAVMANNHVMGHLLKKHAASDRVKTVLNKNKPLAVYFSKKFVMSRPGFIELFNSQVPQCK